LSSEADAATSSRVNLFGDWLTILMPVPPSVDPNTRTATYIARFENLSDVRDFVAQAAADCGLKESAVYSVQLAVDEAFTNIIEHAFGGECQEEIECTCQIKADGLKITLRDCGKPFNPLSVPEPDLNAGLEQRQVGGLGLYFIRQLMDEVHFTFLPGENDQNGCNILTLVKYKEK
jgi:serine/threonine-protein kinase RsbW